MKVVRKKVEHLIVEVAQAEEPQKGPVLLIPGLPQLIHKHPLVELLCRQGYETWLPQLSGSWDSGKEFSPDNHIEDIGLLLSTVPHLRALIGYSYGAGIAAIAASECEFSEKVLLIAPLLDYRSYAASAASLVQYLEEYYPFSYRLSSELLLKHLQGLHLNPLENTSVLNASYFMAYGSKDTDMDPATLGTFCTKAGITPLVVDCSHSLDSFMAQDSFVNGLEQFLER